MWAHATYLLSVGLIATLLSLPVLAVELGHSRVTSAPGQPLVVVVPLQNISQVDSESLSVEIAGAAQWQAAGLTPPVSLDTLRLAIEQGNKVDGRLVRITSSQATEQTVVDVLLAVSTESANRTLQTSIIVPPPPAVRLASESVTVQRGDTLIGIAEQFPVSGANLYQQLWAFYSANTGAFMRDNMNLLKAGASLRVPDADAVRAVDPAFAKAQYLAHVRAFRQGSGGGQGDLGIAADASVQTLQTQSDDGQRKEVEPAEAEPTAPVNDQVRLTAADATSAQAQADAAVSSQRELAEETDRQQALEQNIDALQGAIAQATNGQGGATTAQAADAASAVSDADNQATNTDADGQSVTGGESAQSALTAADVVSTAGGSDGPNGASTGQSATGQSTAGQTTTSSNAFERLGQWVTDNTTAAIAILLALIALIIAWALRVSKTKSSAGSASPRVEQATANFEAKLKDIDLSLDDKPAPPQPKSDVKD